jgi:hypothetical protein
VTVQCTAHASGPLLTLAFACRTTKRLYHHGLVALRVYRFYLVALTALPVKILSRLMCI